MQYSNYKSLLNGVNNLNEVLLITKTMGAFWFCMKPLDVIFLVITKWSMPLYL